MADQVNGVFSPWLRARRIETIRPFLKGRILDVGCGVGSLSQFVSSENYLGVDSDDESLRMRRSR